MVHGKEKNYKRVQLTLILSHEVSLSKIKKLIANLLIVFLLTQFSNN